MELNYENNKIKKLFINILLKKGLKFKSEKLLKTVLIDIKKITKKKPENILDNFIKNLSPKLKIIELQKSKRWKKRKKYKNSYLFIFLNKDKQIKTSIKWLFLKNKFDNYETTKNIIQTSINRSKIINYKKNYYKDIKKLKFFFNF
jgi:ribosomal protein S7